MRGKTTHISTGPLQIVGSNHQLLFSISFLSTFPQTLCKQVFEGIRNEPVGKTFMENSDNKTK